MATKRSAKISPALKTMRDRLFEQLPKDDRHVQARAMAAHIGRLADAVAAMEKLAESPNPTETEARHQQRVADAGKKVQERAAAAWDHLNELLHDGTTAIDQKINEKANLRMNGYAEEIRASVRAMPAAERNRVLVNALDAGDAATVAALTDAPSIVTGIDADYAGRIRQSYVEKHAPDEHAAMSALHETASTAFTAASEAKAAANAATDPRYIGDIQRQAEKAEQAQGEFNQAMEGQP